MATEEGATNQYIGSGQLQVAVFLGSIARPVPGARITISDSTTNTVLEELVTDDSGLAPVVTLPAPPLEFSLNPDEPRPFSQYNLMVQQEGDPEVQIEHVQIYPDTLAIQNVVLKAEEQNIVIPYPVLWGDFPPKIPEAEIKELPFPSDLVVLPKPVIPEFVVVHAGAPSNSAAPEYTVGYRDYLKNVASSEIYATWEREALKANLLAIGSFTLNRVFTEWYRGKGFGFTITNSTAYDQAFTYGRTIYDEISDVVDEVFTTYITKANIMQPLFTQYSDGRRVVRQGWLSQWGSQELAKQGYTAEQILKHYYGQDIIFKQAEKVQGIPMSFPGYVLKLGASGDAVRMIQRQINAISNNYPAIPKVAVDGVYGSGTQAAVKKFQEIFKLPATGEVNFPTWYEISNVYVAVEKLS